MLQGFQPYGRMTPQVTPYTVLTSGELLSSSHTVLLQSQFLPHSAPLLLTGVSAAPSTAR